MLDWLGKGIHHPWRRNIVRPQSALAFARIVRGAFRCHKNPCHHSRLTKQRVCLDCLRAAIVSNGFGETHHVYMCNFAISARPFVVSDQHRRLFDFVRFIKPSVSSFILSDWKSVSLTPTCSYAGMASCTTLFRCC